MLLAMKLSRALLFVVALLLPGAVPGLPPSLAEDFSEEVTSIQSLSAATAAELATFTGQFLELNRLSSRDAKTAKSLAGCKGQFSRNGLSTLEADAAPLAGDGS